MQYSLETFTETRYLTDSHAPYKIEERIVRTKRGVDPSPWNVQGPSPTFFKDGTESLEVPSTAYVKGCHRCYGKGSYCCEKCKGRGKNPCSSCRGAGYQMEMGRQRQCTWCKGTGEDNFTCTTCSGRKQTKCIDCEGSGMIKCFTKLTIEWKTHKSQHAVECEELPEDLIKNVSGHVVFSEQSQQLLPIDHFPDQTVNNASRDLIHEHQRSFRYQRVIMQRHSVTMIPVTEVQYSWKSRTSSYFVFGFEHKVYAPDYPQQCCCAIM